MVTREQAIEIASHELVRHDYSPSDYDISVDPGDAGGDYWLVWFEMKGAFPVPGGRHGVRVNKISGEAQFMAGE